MKMISIKQSGRLFFHIHGFKKVTTIEGMYMCCGFEMYTHGPLIVGVDYKEKEFLVFLYFNDGKEIVPVKTNGKFKNLEDLFTQLNAIYMRKPVFIIAGHDAENRGALSAGNIMGWHWEHEFTTDLQKQVIAGIQSAVGLYGSEMQPYTDSEHKSLSQVIRDINMLSEDGSRGLDIHFNNNNPRASGVEIIVHPNTSEENKARATWIVKRLSQIMEIPHRTRADDRAYIYPDETYLGSLGIIEKTKIPMILVEVCFLNENDLWKYIPKRHEVAEVLRQGMFYKDFTI